MKRQRTPLRSALAPVLGLLLIATATACGGDDDDDGDAGTDGGGAAAGSESGGAGSGAVEDTRLEYAQCMRENGVEEFPDPEPNSNTFELKGPDEYNVDQQTFDAAMEACRDLAPGGGMQPDLSAEDIETLGKFTDCMNDEGIDMPDPDSDGGLSMPDGVDPSSSEFQNAMAACRDVLNGVPILMGG